MPTALCPNKESYALTKKMPSGPKMGANSKPIPAWGNLIMSLTSIIEEIKVNPPLKRL